MNALRWFVVILGVLGLGTEGQAEPVATAHHTYAIIGTAANTVRGTNAARRFLWLINDSDTIIYCTVDDTASALNEGIRLAAAGTTGDRIVFDRNVPTGAVNCISSAGAKRLLIIEGR